MTSFIRAFLILKNIDRKTLLVALVAFKVFGLMFFLSYR